MVHALAPALAFFLGVFTLLNVVGELFAPGFYANRCSVEETRPPDSSRLSSASLREDPLPVPVFANRATPSVGIRIDSRRIPLRIQPRRAVHFGVDEIVVVLLFELPDLVGHVAV